MLSRATVSTMFASTPSTQASTPSTQDITRREHQGTPVLLLNSRGWFRRMARQILEDAGHEVWCAQNGREAQAILRKKPITLVLMDLALHQEHSLTLMQELRRELDDISFLLLSEQDASTTYWRTLDMGVVGTFCKHAPLYELCEAVTHHLSTRLPPLPYQRKRQHLQRLFHQHIG